MLQVSTAWFLAYWSNKEFENLTQFITIWIVQTTYVYSKKYALETHVVHGAGHRQPPDPGKTEHGSVQVCHACLQMLLFKLCWFLVLVFWKSQICVQSLQGPWRRHDAKESEQRYGVCDFSWCYTNVLSGSGGSAQKFQLFRTLSPPQSYQLLLVYFTPGVVRFQQCVRASGLNRDLMRRVRKRGTILFADGAKSWRKAAESSGLHFESVDHSLLQFAKSVTLPKGVRAAGPKKKLEDHSWYTNPGPCMAGLEKICSVRITCQTIRQILSMEICGNTKIPGSGVAIAAWIFGRACRTCSMPKKGLASSIRRLKTSWILEHFYTDDELWLKVSKTPPPLQRTWPWVPLSGRHGVFISRYFSPQANPLGKLAPVAEWLAITKCFFNHPSGWTAGCEKLMRRTQWRNSNYLGSLQSEACIFHQKFPWLPSFFQTNMAMKNNVSKLTCIIFPS